MRSCGVANRFWFEERRSIVTTMHTVAQGVPGPASDMIWEAVDEFVVTSIDDHPQIPIREKFQCVGSLIIIPKTSCSASDGIVIVIVFAVVAAKAVRDHVIVFVIYSVGVH